jgi:GntR family transcriptional regulator, transcriptional repressor for pyruvate dehydrogenase complex
MASFARVLAPGERRGENLKCFLTWQEQLDIKTKKLTLSSGHTAMGLEKLTFNRARVSDQIMEVIKQAFLRGDFKPGDKLPREDEIAAQFKVSKVTVREALREMEAEGLIEKRRGVFGGNFASQPGSQKMGELVVNYYRFGSITPEELSEFREVLEPDLIAIAAERRTDEDLQRMRENIEKVEESFAQGKPNPKMQVEFHRLIADACHNRLTSTVTEALTEVFFEILAGLDITFEESVRDLEFNKQFFDCILRRDKRGGRRIMMQHFASFRKIAARNKKLKVQDS